MANENIVCDIKEIMSIIPHRYPFLLVDRITDVNENGGKGYKNITMNEEFFQGHFPGEPIMPGVLIVEGMAQCGGVIGLKLMKMKAEEVGEKVKDKIILFMMIDNVKFRRQVMPGDRLDYELEIVKFGKIGKFKGKAYVDGQVAAEADMMAMIRDRDE